MIWAQAIDGSDNRYTARLSTPDAYDFTVNSILEIATRLSAFLRPLGLVTPAQAFGADFVLDLPGCFRENLTAN